jgi:hypothetical protein
MTIFIVAIVCLMVGACAGLLVAALCFAARDDR